MTREIKFRAWDKERKKMYYSGKFEISFYSSMWFVKDWISRYELLNADDGGILMQWTGLKDKNGVCVYEGDINMDYDNEKSEVIFYGGGFRLRYNEYEYRNIGSYAPFDRLVIGNVWENPDLLKK